MLVWVESRLATKHLHRRLEFLDLVSQPVDEQVGPWFRLALGAIGLRRAFVLGLITVLVGSVGYVQYLVRSRRCLGAVRLSLASCHASLFLGSTLGGLGDNATKSPRVPALLCT